MIARIYIGLRLNHITDYLVSAVVFLLSSRCCSSHPALKSLSPTPIVEVSSLVVSQLYTVSRRSAVKTASTRLLPVISYRRAVQRRVGDFLLCPWTIR